MSDLKKISQDAAKGRRASRRFSSGSVTAIRKRGKSREAENLRPSGSRLQRQRVRHVILKASNNLPNRGFNQSAASAVRRLLKKGKSVGQKCRVQCFSPALITIKESWGVWTAVNKRAKLSAGSEHTQGSVHSSAKHLRDASQMSIFHLFFFLTNPPLSGG